MTIHIRLSDKVDDASGGKKNLRVVDCDDPKFEGLWNEFLARYPIYTYRHTLRIFKYWKLVIGGAIKDRSFLLAGKNDQPLAICPLFIVEDKQGRRICSSDPDRYSAIPLTYPHFSEKQRRAAEDVAFEEAIIRLETENVERWPVEADILSVGTELIEDQVFARKGALDVSIHQHIVDLTGDEEALRRQIRRRAHAEINGGLKAYEFLVFDQDNYTDDVGERHRLLHRKTAGRDTRPIESFHCTYDWIKKGEAFFVEQRFEGQAVNMTLVQMSKGTAIGASTADDPDFNAKVPLMHSMMWTIFMECKKRGIKYSEIGETNFRDTLHQILTPKEKNIIYFKRGFGEHSWPQKRWIWFSSPEGELQYLKDRLRLYEQHITGLALQEGESNGS